MYMLHYIVCMYCVQQTHTHTQRKYTYTHPHTHFRAMEYLLVPDSLSLTRKLASLQRCS